MRADTDRFVPPGYAAGAPVPWWVKLGVKLVLGSLPVPARVWRALGLRRHSFAADDPARLVPPLADRIALATQRIGRAPRSVLEIGPGAMVRRAPIAAALGLGPILYLDVEDDAPRELDPYRRAAEAARAAGLAPPDLSGCATHEDVLAACGARLLIGGPERLAEIPPGSVDLVFSEVALEHVRRDALAPLLRALRRVSAPDGIGLHGVDFHDHLGGALRHLRFAPSFWEGAAVGRAGLYNNRLGLSEMLEQFAEAGFAATATHRLLWEAPPLPPGGAHPGLHRRAEDDHVCYADIEARPA
ncbi:class I SAM-dependent methyltransferase [Roseomonas sp. AR75]|uniref:methyltransferase domain-containing protein n=1 Tax=Roseomonas sp. AR75 TaxID=2562311 RepID=UPI0010BFACD7|nr:class I SAM-dependent methyltransferase [Roseomonas sp. AR75]